MARIEIEIPGEGFMRPVEVYREAESGTFLLLQEDDGDISYQIRFPDHVMIDILRAVFGNKVSPEVMEDFLKEPYRYHLVKVDVID